MDQYVMVPVAIKYGAAGVGASVLIGGAATTVSPRQARRRQPMRRRPAALRAAPC